MFSILPFLRCKLPQSVRYKLSLLFSLNILEKDLNPPLKKSIKSWYERFVEAYTIERVNIGKSVGINIT
jgi:hypothetical protein